jgi:hypothetical protein
MESQETENDILELAAEADWLWLMSELAYAWRTAQDEAVTAYDAWSESPGAAAYAVYRAAQDRADQAQDVLAETVTAHEQEPQMHSSLHPQAAEHAGC